MTSLAEVYSDARNEDLRRLYLGTGLFVAGACMVVVAIAAATTDLLAPLGLDVFEARELAGVLAGLGVPGVFVGIFTVLPAGRRERAAAAIGASIAVFGVILFWWAYPERWAGATPNHVTLPVAAVYFLGTITTFWSLFTAVVNFKTRNDPGGTVTLKRTVAGETETIEVPRSELEGGSLGDLGALGGVGVLGDVDRNAVEEGRPDDAVVERRDDRTDDAVVERREDDAVVERSGPRGGTAPASDGGTDPEPIRSPGPSPDRYCGNCAAFDYVRGDDGMQPYCGHFGETMDDMDPCDNWRQR